MNAPLVHPHTTVLNAFLVSIVLRAQYFLVSPFLRSPPMTSTAVMACIADFLNKILIFFALGNRKVFRLDFTVGVFCEPIYPFSTRKNFQYFTGKIIIIDATQANRWIKKST